MEKKKYLVSLTDDQVTLITSGSQLNINGRIYYFLPLIYLETNEKNVFEVEYIGDSNVKKHFINETLFKDE